MQLVNLKTSVAQRQIDKNSFEQLFRQLYTPLCHYACSFIADSDDAEELVQSAFITLWEKRNAVEITTSAKSYLYMMVRNNALNKIKHEQVKRQYASEHLHLHEEAHESSNQKIIGKELEQKIRQVIEILPEQCRLIFKMSRFEELKYADIAGQLNLSVKTVENQMGKALRILRNELKEFLPLLFLIIRHWIK